MPFAQVCGFGSGVRGARGLRRLCYSILLLCSGRPCSTTVYRSTHKRILRPLTCNHLWKARYISHAKFSRAFSISDDGDRVLQEWEIDTLELFELLQKDTVYLIDVREPYEVEEMGKLAPDAVNVPLDEVEDALEMTAEEFQLKYQSSLPPRDSSLVFYCMAGVRSLVALDSALNLGYTDVRHYIRGWIGWQEYLDNQSS